jgi:hypothetical protein
MAQSNISIKLVLINSIRFPKYTINIKDKYIKEMASVHLERDQHIIYVKHYFMLSGMKGGRAILSVEEHKIIPPFSPQPCFCQKNLYLHSNFPTLQFLINQTELRIFAILQCTLPH